MTDSPQTSGVPVIGFIGGEIDHFHEAMALLMSRGGRCRPMFITETDLTKFPNTAEHPHILRRLTTFDGIDVVDYNQPARPVDWLFVVMKTHQPAGSPQIRRWMKSARHFACVSQTDHTQGWKIWARELYHSFPYYLHADAVILQGRETRWHPYHFIKRKLNYWANVHPQIYTKPGLEQVMFAPCDTQTPRRRFRFSFTGSSTPDARAAALRRIEARLRAIPKVRFHENAVPPDDTAMADDEQHVLWIEYDHSKANSPKPLTPLEYIKTLNQSDFCISPMGWGPLWNHRVAEAAVRGSIPLTHDAGRHNLGFEDNVNCIIAHHDQWEEAIDRAAAMGDDQVIRMRRNLVEMASRRIAPDAAGARLRRELGL